MRKRNLLVPHIPTKVRPKLARDQEKERRMKLKEANLKKMVYNKSLMERNLELMDRLEVASRHGRDEKRLSEAVEEERRYLEHAHDHHKCQWCHVGVWNRPGW